MIVSTILRKARPTQGTKNADEMETQARKGQGSRVYIDVTETKTRLNARIEESSSTPSQDDYANS